MYGTDEDYGWREWIANYTTCQLTHPVKSTGFIQLYESYRVLISRVVQAILLTFYSRCGMSIQLCNVKHIRVDF